MLEGIPEDIEKWDIHVLRKICEIREIEGETLDVKDKEDINHDIRRDVCAFANNLGGILVFGLREVKTSKNYLTGFKLNGWSKGEEDEVFKKITNKVSELEPIPSFTKHLVRDESENFYIIISIAREETKKPFFFKNSSNCYIRVGSSSREASRGILLTLFARHMVPFEGRNSHNFYIGKIFEKLHLIHVSDIYRRLRLIVPNNPKDFLFYINDPDPEVTSDDFDMSTCNPKDIDHLDWALAHLETGDYADLFSQWKRIGQLVEEYNETIDNNFRDFVSQVQNILETDKQTFELIGSLFDIKDLSDEYQLEKLSGSLYARINFLPDPTGIHGYSHHALSFDDIYPLEVPYYYEKTKRTIIGDELVKGKLRELTDIAHQIFKENILQSFELMSLLHGFGYRIGLLARDLKAGDFVKGYCKLGY